MSYGAGVAADATEDRFGKTLRLDALKLAQQTLEQNGDEYTPDDVVAAADKYMAFVNAPAAKQIAEVAVKAVEESLAQVSEIITGGIRS